MSTVYAYRRVGCRRVGAACRWPLYCSGCLFVPIDLDGTPPPPWSPYPEPHDGVYVPPGAS